MKWSCFAPLLLLPASGLCYLYADPPSQANRPALQYDSGDIKIAAASVDEPRVASFNKDSIWAANKYLDEGAVAWMRERTCIACHTPGVYMAERPALTTLLGAPSESVRTDFVKAIPDQIPNPATDGEISYYRLADRAVWRTLGLAEWDKHVTGNLSADTSRSLRDMLLQQSSHGGYHVTGEVEIPYVTTDFNLTLQAARAISVAPGWLDNLADDDLLRRVQKLKDFLREAKPRNDYERVLKLQLARLMPGLVHENEIEQAVALLWRKQLPDGGWSTRLMSDTMDWHVAVSERVKNLIEGLTDAENPGSDAYMTAFAIVLLREQGVPSADERIQRGLAWLKREQRQSGRWWMHSLYRGNYHFTSYIATALAMKALALCGEIPGELVVGNTAGLLGEWSLTLPSGEAGWLAVGNDSGKVRVEMLWGVGSARPVEVFELRAGKLEFRRNIKHPMAAKGEAAGRYRVTAQAVGDALHCELISVENGSPVKFFGKRQPPLPVKPDLTKLEFGRPISLFNERDLSGWVLSNSEKKNGWSVREGILCNDTPKTDFGAYGEYGNLRTEAEFSDFKLHIEYRLPATNGGNSGIYLRGMYEVQVTHRDSPMQGINGPGAVFGRIEPTHNAGKSAGCWETLDITLVDRHVTVVLNAEKVIDNQPVVGCTGGALLCDVTQPGPIYLQGDHTSVQYRNISLRKLLTPR